MTQGGKGAGLSLVEDEGTYLGRRCIGINEGKGGGAEIRNVMSMRSAIVASSLWFAIAAIVVSRRGGRLFIRL